MSAICYNTTRDVTILVCFAGKNQRIKIEPKKCIKNNKNFTYNTHYKADNGTTYLVKIESIKGTNGACANVVVYSNNGKKVIAERHNVDVRFHRYIF